MGDDVLVDGVLRDFGRGSDAVRALHGVSLRARAGEFLVLLGPSGAGKTTLLNIVGGLDRPTGGRVFVGDVEVSAASAEELCRLRRTTIGFVLQSFALVPALCAAENVSVPLRLAETAPRLREERVAMLLELVGLAEQGLALPAQLSGGQRQRVAFARALANDPALLIADEPTGQLDSRTAMEIMELLRAVASALGITALVATHDPAVAALADRVLTLRDGRLDGASGS